MANADVLPDEGALVVEPHLCPLSERQLEVLRGLYDGKTYKQIAADLYVTRSTISSHAKRIYDLLGVPNASQAAILAYRNSWLTDCKPRQGNDQRAAPESRADSPMAELRKLCDLNVKVKRIALNRDRLILDALGEGHTQHEVARAAGLSQARIWDINDQGQSRKTEEKTPLAQLRKMRDLQERIGELAADRNRLIREASANYSEQTIAEAAGLTSGRINQIKKGES